MGTTLDNMAKTSKGLLNFETSIQAELKASALIGKNINFNEARRLAFQGKTVEANKLILDQAKKIKFNQLNPLAQEAFAAAAGKSVKELQDMLESENRMKSALTSNNKEVREAAKAQIEKQNLLKSNSKLAQQEYEKNLLNKSNQERITVLQDRLNAALMKIMLPVLESITKTMEELVNLTGQIDLKTLIKDLYSANVLVKNIVANKITKTIENIKTALSLPFKLLKILSDAFGRTFTTISESIIKVVNKFDSLRKILNLIKGYLVNFELIAKSKFLSVVEFFNKLISEIKLTEFAKTLSKLGDVKWIKNLLTKMRDFIDYFKVLRLEGNGFFSSIIEATKTLLSGGKLTGIIDKMKKLGNIIIEFLPFLKNIGTYFPLVGKIFSKIPVIGNIITSLQFLYESWKNVMEVLNNPNLTGLQKIGGVLSGIGKAAYTTLVEPFIDMGKWIGENVFGSIYDSILDVAEGAYNIGASLLDGIVTATKDLTNKITKPFSDAWEKISDWLGFSPSVLGLSIVKGIVSIGGALIDAITSPFEKAFEIVKMGLELIWEKMKGIGSFISETIGKTFSFVGRIVGVTEEPAAKTAGETKTNVKTDDLLITAIVNSNKAVLEKLDKLTNLMSSGQIAVYIDGQRANQLLATSNAKFGSFGQATTN